MNKISFILFIFLISACRSSGYYHVQRLDINRNIRPLDIREAILINGLRDLSYNESEMFITNIQRQLKSNGFMETYSSEEIEVELLSAGIRDFTIQRNVDRLYTELGIIYLLQVDIVDRRKAGRGKLSALSAANREYDRNHVNMYNYPASKHLVDIQYSLYQVDMSDTLAVYRVRAEHKWDNTFLPEIIRRDIQKLIDHCNLGVAY